MYWYKILILILSGTIFFEDMMSRAVHWYLFPLFTIVLVLLGYKVTGDLTIIFQQAFYNIVFILVQISLLTLYFSVKNKKLTNIAQGLIGWGDILFLLAIAFYFSFVNYILFYIISLVGVLLIWIAIRLISERNNKHIPLAGLQALFFAILFAIAWFEPTVKLTDDTWIINRIIA